MGSLQSENDINISARNGAQIANGTNSRLRLGVAHCLKLLIDLPNYCAVPLGQPGSGFDNVTPAFKWQIIPVPGNSISPQPWPRPANRGKDRHWARRAALSAVFPVE